MSAAEQFLEYVTADGRRLDRIPHNERLILSAGELRHVLRQAFEAGERRGQDITADGRRLDRIPHNERLILSAGELRHVLRQAFEAGERRGQDILQQIAEGVQP